MINSLESEILSMYPMSIETVYLFGVEEYGWTNVEVLRQPVPYRKRPG